MYAIRAACFLKLGQPEKAEHDAQQALALVPLVVVASKQDFYPLASVVYPQMTLLLLFNKQQTNVATTARMKILAIRASLNLLGDDTRVSASTMIEPRVGPE